MPGPDPNPNRQRRNTPVKEQVRAVLPKGGRRGRPPNAPPWAPSGEWCDLQWKRWWTSPQASQWDSGVHVPILGRLLLLYVEDPESTEIRQIEHQMGLTPKGMKDLGWRVDDEPKPEKAAKKSGSRKSKSSDPRAVLRAV